jgi:hypothetical protein
MLWQHSYVDAWIARLAAIGCDIRNSNTRVQDFREAASRAYERLDDARVCAIADTAYRIDYWVAPKNVASHLPVAFATDNVVVHAVRKACPLVSEAATEH